MRRTKQLAAAMIALALSGAMSVPQAVAGPLDGFAGAAVGFALGAMVAGQRGGYYAPRYRRAVVYRSRPAVRRQVVAAPARRASVRVGGYAINSSSDPFAGSASAKAVPVAGR